MKNLYKTKVTTHGGRNGHTRSEDGILDMELKCSRPEGRFLHLRKRKEYWHTHRICP